MTFYLFSSGAYLAFLLFNKFNDSDSKTNLTFLLVMIVASAFWIVVIPISLIEIKFKAYVMCIEEMEKLINSEVNSQDGSLEPEFDSDTLQSTTENT